MKYQHVSNIFYSLIFTLSMICISLPTSAAIVRTDVVIYDLATANQRSYSLHMLPTAKGAQVILHRNDKAFSLSTEVATCFSRQTSRYPQGYLWLKEKSIQHTDLALLPILNFTQDNRLRVSMAPLADTQSALLDRDSLNVLIVDHTMMTLGSAGCER